MRTFLSAPVRNITGNMYSVTPYNLHAEQQLIVGLVAVLVAVPPSAFHSITLHLCNKSLGIQNIRVGFAPSFATVPPTGYMLEPGESVDLYNLNFAVSAISDLANGLLERFVTSQLIQ